VPAVALLPPWPPTNPTPPDPPIPPAPPPRPAAPPFPAAPAPMLPPSPVPPVPSFDRRQLAATDAIRHSQTRQWDARTVMKRRGRPGAAHRL